MAASFSNIFFCTSDARSTYKDRRTKPRPDTAHRKIAKPPNIGAVRPAPKRARTHSLDPTIACLLRHAKSGDMDAALRLFEEANNPMDAFLWNVMIRGYADNGLYEEAIEFYRWMAFVGARMDSFTFPFVLKSCAGLFSYVEGSKAHCRLIKIGLDEDVFICNALVTMYAKKMQKVDSLYPDAITLVNLLPACAQLRGLLQGKSIHGKAIRSGFLPFSVLETVLVDMYASCADLQSAECYTLIEDESSRGSEGTLVKDTYEPLD
ncbi:hypothetical protein ACLOJK_002265 [Asimina triloba]